MGRRREVTTRIGQDREDFAKALALLADYFRVADDYLDDRRMRVYDHGLRDVPGPLVMGAALYATETRSFFPKVVELKADCAVVRQRLLAEHVYRPCAACLESNAPGWMRVFDTAGTERLTRCDCWHLWRESLAQLGVTPTPLMLSAPERERERDRAFAGQGEDD